MPSFHPLASRTWPAGGACIRAAIVTADARSPVEIHRACLGGHWVSCSRRPRRFSLSRHSRSRRGASRLWLHHGVKSGEPPSACSGEEGSKSRVSRTSAPQRCTPRKRRLTYAVRDVKRGHRLRFRTLRTGVPSSLTTRAALPDRMSCRRVSRVKPG